MTAVANQGGTMRNRKAAESKNDYIEGSAGLGFSKKDYDDKEYNPDATLKNNNTDLRWGSSTKPIRPKHKRRVEEPENYSGKITEYYESKYQDVYDIFEKSFSNSPEIKESIRKKESRDNKFPLHRYAHWGHLELVQQELEKGAFINAMDESNNTPLDYVVMGKKMYQEFNLGSTEKLKQFDAVISLCERSNAKYGYDILEQRERKAKLEARQAMWKTILFVILGIIFAGLSIAYKYGEDEVHKLEDEAMNVIRHNIIGDADDALIDS